MEGTNPFTVADAVRQPSVYLLGQCDDDAFRASDVTQTVLVFVLCQLADEFSGRGPLGG
jgi:hypothetical protein